MVALGILSFTHSTSYLLKVAESAVKKNIAIYIFSPRELQIGSDLVYGLHFNPDKKVWEDKTFPIPTFIYDRCYYSSSQKRASLYKVEAIKQRSDIFFLGYGLPDKWKVYQAIHKNQELLPFLPLTRRLTSSAFLLAHLKPDQKWLLKPLYGSQGKGLIKLEEKAGKYLIKEVQQPGERIFTFTSAEHLQKWLHSRLQNRSYLFQPFLPLQNSNGLPFDIRILLQKDEKGEWLERIRVIRTGIKNHITSNLSGGGKMLPFSSLQKRLSNLQQIQLEESIQKIIAVLPSEVESKFLPLFEIGLDLGLDSDLNLWILDINSKPGHKIVSMAPPSVQKEIYEAPSKYCSFLASSKGNKLGVD